jgi:hypothetical protein
MSPRWKPLCKKKCILHLERHDQRCWYIRAGLSQSKCRSPCWATVLRYISLFVAASIRFTRVHAQFGHRITLIKVHTILSFGSPRCHRHYARSIYVLIWALQEDYIQPDSFSSTSLRTECLCCLSIKNRFGVVFIHTHHNFIGH